MGCRYFIAFALILAHGTIFPVIGQSTVHVNGNGDSTMSMTTERQTLWLLDEIIVHVQNLQKFHNASFQEMMSQFNISMRKFETVERRLDDHDIYIKNQTDIVIRNLQAVDRRLQEHDTYIKNQTDSNRSLQAIDQRLQDHDIYIKNQTDIIMRSLQAVDRRLDDHDIYIKNQTDIIMRNFQAVDRRLDDIYIKNQTDTSMKNLEAVERRLQEHDSYIKNQTDIIMRNLQAFDRRLQEHDINIKNQTDSNRSLQAVEQRLQDHDIYIKNQTEIIIKTLQTVDERLQKHDIYIKNQTQEGCSRESQVRDCSDIRASGQNASGVYEVCVKLPLTRICRNASCDMDSPNGTSLVFQRRTNGSVDFDRTWSEFKEGFGDQNGEFWLGNEMLYLLTSRRKYKLRIDLEDFEGKKRYAEYARFSISSSADNYAIAVRGYSGNADDCLSYHNGQQFTTKDVDNDDSGDTNCAQHFHAAWWYSNCHWSNLNGEYYERNCSLYANSQRGIHWSCWSGLWYFLKATEMKLIAVG